MRRAVKFPDSKIITGNLKYSSTNSFRNKEIAEILLKEQKSFCACTDEYISIRDANDVEHFNPTLKNTPEDGYDNWFCVKHQVNKTKGSKWATFQPVLHPTASDFEERIIHNSGDYFAKSDTDVEAKNLIGLLQLDNPALADKRKRYSRRKVADMKASKQEANEFFSVLLEMEPCGILYSRAIKEEFGFDIWQVLNSQE